jgi:large subunit ribosomal protein L30
MKKLKVTLERSTVRKLQTQKRTVKAMGFHRLHETRIFPDNPAVRGMINRVAHLVSWVQVDVQE